MDYHTTENAILFLQTLINQPLCYGLKSPDMDLYDFGFGELIEVIGCSGERRKICTHTLHVVCRFKVIWKSEEQRIDRYYEDTPYEAFRSKMQRLVGLRVKRIALSQKNDLWLDLDACWVVFATFENGDESWRFFTSDANSPHLIASDSGLVLYSTFI